jgi:hypothetical protein
MEGLGAALFRAPAEADRVGDEQDEAHDADDEAERPSEEDEDDACNDQCERKSNHGRFYFPRATRPNP